MWVSDEDDDKLYTYPLPDFVPPPDALSVEHVTDTMALVKVDISELVRAYGREEPAVSVSVLGSLSSATMYVHPDGGYARFLLLGLRPETQYTVVTSYGVVTKYDLGDTGREVFRTDYARLSGIETSGLTHAEATVTVSLNAAGLDRGCCFKFYPHSNKGEAERVYTFYLRHKPSDDTAWSNPVQLTFSDFTADARLTDLDPGTAYDVEVAETEDFMPPQGSAGSYQGTMTVGNDDGVSGIGFDQDGFQGVFDPYGSISPTTFELGSVDHSIVELRVGVASFLAPGQAGKLFLMFDKALPDDAAFTLTVDTTTFNSSDATVSGRTYSWAGGPSLTNGESVAVELDFTGAVPFREGTTLEGAFTTPPLPETLAFEAEMTVGVTTSFDGYYGDYAIVYPPTGSISSNTFEVGGVQYAVGDVSYEKGANPRFTLGVAPALPYESFTLTLGSTELLSSSATVEVNIDGSGIYHWSGTNPNWNQGQMVDVKLDIELINICDRSPAVAHAIREATPSFDYCHTTSPIDLANLTELDLPGGRGTGLKAGDFEGLSGLTRLDLSYYELGGLRPQLPVGVFDGLDSLTHLDISHTGLMSLDLGVFEGLDNLVELNLSDTSLQRDSVPVGVFDPLDNLEVLRLKDAGYLGRGIHFFDDDIFRGLGNLRVLDMRPSNSYLTAPRAFMPLTSLETYNGRTYIRALDPPHNLTATMSTFSGDSLKRTVTLTWDLPPSYNPNFARRWQILRTDNGHPLKRRPQEEGGGYYYDYSRFAHEVGNVALSLSARTFTHGASDGIKAGPNGFAFTYYVVLTGSGGVHLSFPARVFVSD